MPQKPNIRSPESAEPTTPVAPSAAPPPGRANASCGFTELPEAPGRVWLTVNKGVSLKVALQIAQVLLDDTAAD